MLLLTNCIHGQLVYSEIGVADQLERVLVFLMGSGDTVVGKPGVRFDRIVSDPGDSTHVATVRVIHVRARTLFVTKMGTARRTTHVHIAYLAF